MNKKIIFIILGLISLAVAFILWFFKPFSSEDSSMISTKPLTERKILQVNTLELEKRPYIILEPKSNIEPKSLGHWVTVTIDKIGGFEEVEYEFEYTTGSMIQGGMGRIDFTKEKPPVSKEIAFGSASKGKYKYDEGVYEGKFTFQFFNGEEAALKTDFNLQNKTEVEGLFTSPDEKVSLEVGSSDLESDDYLVIASTLGLPEIPEGEIIAGPYGFYADGPRSLANAALIFKGVEKEGVVVLRWNGDSWQEYETEVSGGKASAEVDSLGAFVLVEK